jgi:hypothetical protein
MIATLATANLNKFSIRKYVFSLMCQRSAVTQRIVTNANL